MEIKSKRNATRKSLSKGNTDLSNVLARVTLSNHLSFFFLLLPMFFYYVLPSLLLVVLPSRQITPFPFSRIATTLFSQKIDPVK